MSYIGQTLQTKRFNFWLFLFLKFNEVSQGSLDVYQVSWHDPKTRIYLFYGWGFQLFSRYLDISCSGGVKQTLWTLTYIPFDTRNKNIYDFEVGISTVFKIFGHSLFAGGQAHLRGPWTAYYLMPLTQRTRIFMV